MVSECGQTVWLRFSEEAAASVTALEEQRPLRVDAGQTVRDSIFDKGPDGFAMAVSTSENSVGRIISVPHGKDDVVRVVLAGDQCSG